MKRRTLLIGAGGLAIGSGVIFGSGAFTQVSADRGVTINVEDDDEALLGLNPNDTLDSVGLKDGDLFINSNELTDGSSNEGFNVASTVNIGTTSGSNISGGVDDGDEAFKIVNNFNQPIDILVEFDGLGDNNGNVLTFIVTADDGNSTRTEKFNTNNKDGFGITGVDPDGEGVPAGAEARVALKLETEGGTSPADLSGTITFSASGEPDTGANPPEPTPEIKIVGGNTFPTLTEAVNNVSDGDTIEVTGPGVLSEDVTVNTNGVTLRGINSPSIDGTVTENANNITIEGFDQNSITTLILQGGTGSSRASISNCTINTLTPDGGEAKIDNSAVEDIGSGSGSINDISTGQGVEVGSGLISVSPGDGADGGLFTSLSSAVSRANNNATVRVGPDTYNETVTIDAEGLTLTSTQGAEQTTIGDASGPSLSGPIVRINAPNVEVDGFEVAGASGSGEAGQGIDVNGDQNDTDGVELRNLEVRNNDDRGLVVDFTDSATIENVVAESNYDRSSQSGDPPEDGFSSPDDADGITLFYTNNSTLSNVTARNNGDNGIYVKGDNNTLENITVDANADEGLDLSSDAGSDGDTAGGATVKNLTTEGNSGQEVEIEGHSNNVTIENSDITVDTNGGDSDGLQPAGIAVPEMDGGSVTISNTSFEFGDSGNLAYVSDDAGAVDLDAILNNQGNTFDPTGEVVGDQILVEGTAPANTVVNLDSGSTFDTIQAAVNAAGSGDTLRVGSGSFSGVDINVDGLTLEGPNDGIAGDSGSRSAEATITGGVFVDGNPSDVVIDGLAIERTVGEAEGVVQVGSTSNPGANNLTIRNNVITATSDGSKNLGTIIIEQIDGEIRIEDNLLTQTGDGRVRGLVQQLQLDNTAIVVDGNTIETNVGLLLSGQGLSGGDGPSPEYTITDNEFVENDRLGVDLAGNYDGVVEISGNTFEGGSVQIRHLTGATTNITIKSNTFTEASGVVAFVSDRRGANGDVVGLDRDAIEANNSFNPGSKQVGPINFDGEQLFDIAPE